MHKQFSADFISFRGQHDRNVLNYKLQRWSCDQSFFSMLGIEIRASLCWISTLPPSYTSRLDLLHFIVCTLYLIKLTESELRSFCDKAVSLNISGTQKRMAYVRNSFLFITQTTIQIQPGAPRVSHFLWRQALS